MYGSEVWVMSKSYENTLAMWERNILRIFDPVEENGVWKILTNQELMNMCRETNSISEIQKEVYGGWNTRKECQKKKLWRRCLTIPQKDKDLLEIQERDG
jgi:hypothetical protein